MFGCFAVWVWLGGGALLGQSVVRKGGEFQVNGYTFNNQAEPGTVLGSDFRVNTYTPNAQYGPSVAMESNGDFVVV